MVRAGSVQEAEVHALRAHASDEQARLDAWVWEGGNVLVGNGAAAALRQSELHPSRTWLVLATSSKPMLADVVDLVTEARCREGRPLKLRSWDGWHIEALAAAGARPLIDSHLVTLDYGDPGAAAWCASAGPATITERAPDDPMVAAAAWDLYKRIHVWDPVAEGAKSPPMWCNDLVAAATLDDGAGKAVAIACAHAGDPPQAAFIGTLDQHADEADMTASLVAWLLERCNCLEVEADDGAGANPTLVSVLRTIPNAGWAATLHFVELA